MAILIIHNASSRIRLTSFHRYHGPGPDSETAWTDQLGQDSLDLTQTRLPSLKPPCSSFRREPLSAEKRGKIGMML
jgi:hypothetical protein